MRAALSLAACCALGVASATLATTAHADPNTVTVVAGPRASLAHRLAKELEASGIIVHVEDAQPSSDAPALFVVVPEDATAPIEIWTTKDGVTSRLATVASDGPADTRVLRAAEIARALAAPDGGGAAAIPSHVPDDEHPASADGDVPASVGDAGPPADDTAPKRRAKKRRARPVEAPAPRWAEDSDDMAPSTAEEQPSDEAPARFDFALAVALGAQSQGASLQIEGAARVWPADRVGVGLFASAPVAGANIETSVGRATLRSSVFGIELATAPIARTGSFGVILSPGVGIDWVHVEGEAKTPYSSETGDGVQAALYGRGELRVRLTGPLRLTLGALGGAALPAIDITFNGHTQSTFCPFGSASLGAVVEP